MCSTTTRFIWFVPSLRAAVPSPSPSPPPPERKGEEGTATRRLVCPEYEDSFHLKLFEFCEVDVRQQVCAITEQHGGIDSLNCIAAWASNAPGVMNAFLTRLWFTLPTKHLEHIAQILRKGLILWRWNHDEEVKEKDSARSKRHPFTSKPRRTRAFVGQRDIKNNERHAMGMLVLRSHFNMAQVWIKRNFSISCAW